MHFAGSVFHRGNGRLSRAAASQTDGLNRESGGGAAGESWTWSSSWLPAVVDRGSGRAVQPWGQTTPLDGLPHSAA